MKNYLKSYRKLKGEGTIWGLALRQVSGKNLYDGNFSEFTFVKNSFRYWRACHGTYPILACTNKIMKYTWFPSVQDLEE